MSRDQVFDAFKVQCESSAQAIIEAIKLSPDR
jgi:hypothetical protein